MKVIKPQKLGVLYRPYEHEGHCFLAIAVFVYFPFDDPGRLLPEVGMWKLAGAELGDVPLDDGMNKLRAEVLVHGSCYTPHGKPQATCPVRVTIGSVDKTLFVIGDRVWDKEVPTEPEPFSVMPIRYENAFGGEGFADNPLGKGFAPVDGGAVQSLPNIELPKRLIRSIKDHPAPAGLGPYDFSWPQRASKAGTYDDEWLKTRFPGFAKDIDWTLFNTAADDQQIDGFFRQDEAFSVENMHPDKQRLESRLPGVVVRCFANSRRRGGESFDEIHTRIDTVHLFPHVERAIAIYRGLKLVHEDDASDVLQLMVAAEAPAAPKPVEHYRTVLGQRLDRTRPELLLRDSDLMPPAPGGPRHPGERFSDMDQLMAREQLLEKNQRRAAQKRIDGIRADLQSRGMDPAMVPDLPPERPPTEGEELVDRVEELRAEAETRRQQSEEIREQAMADARKLCEERGLDFDKLLAETAEKAGGPPRFSAQAELAKLEDARQLGVNAGIPLPHVDAQLADPALKKKLELAEEKLKDVYRMTAHLQPAACAISGRRALELRDEVTLKAAAGISVEHRDLTGADLSGLRLAGADLCGAFLENADLVGADLTGAKLDRAVLTRARLDGACLSGASLVEANLGGASLRSVRADDADFTRAVLAAADFTDARFPRATLESVDLADARFSNTDFSHVRLGRLNTLHADWRGLVLRAADLTQSVFIDVNLDGVDFSEATLAKSTFLGSRANDASFESGKLSNFRLLNDCDFSGADFTAADLRGANLRGAKLAGADLSDAALEGADFGGADLTGAKGTRVQAKGARFARADLSRADFSEANLMQAVLQHANVAGTSFRKANLFRADVARMRADESTSLKGAFLKRVRVVAPREDDEQV